MRTEQTEEKEKINRSPELKFHRAEHFLSEKNISQRTSLEQETPCHSWYLAPVSESSWVPGNHTS